MPITPFLRSYVLDLFIKYLTEIKDLFSDRNVFYSILMIDLDNIYMHMHNPVLAFMFSLFCWDAQYVENMAGWPCSFSYFISPFSLQHKYLKSVLLSLKDPKMHFHSEGSTFPGSSLDSFAILHQHRQITLHPMSTESNKLAWTMDHANKHLWDIEKINCRVFSQQRKSC